MQSPYDWIAIRGVRSFPYCLLVSLALGPQLPPLDVENLIMIILREFFQSMGLNLIRQ